jgi:hypothetical protein
METTNYYLILKLSVNPPENDPKVIEDAIAKKQTEWSRYRNHPTKATLAQKYIGLLPQIRKVMSDPELRKKEAQNARELMARKEREKFWKIDRHLGIFLSKGHITAQEISKLAEHHAVPEDKLLKRVKEGEKFWKTDKQIEKLISRKGKVSDKKVAQLAKQSGVNDEKIREWIVKKEAGVFREIDKYLHICMNRGYVTGEEITGLARLFEIGEDRILKRIRCPIRKKSKEKDDKPEPIDSTIEQIIYEKLKILGKKDLYDFLEVSSDSGLESLQSKAREKEADIRKIGQKDANTTASGALAGHCIAIFKSQESRNSYDLSIFRKRLNSLESDISISETDGKIRGEYLTVLLKMALRLGTAPDEAEAYIRDYCEKKKWVIEESPKQKQFRLMVIAGIAGAVVLIGLIIFSVWSFNAIRLRADYQKTLVEAENQTNPEQKEQILKGFIKRQGKNDYTPKVEKKIDEVRNLIKKREFDAAVRESKRLTQAGELEKAIGVFEQYLKKFPDGIHTNEAKQKIVQIKDQIDDNAYSSLNSFQGGFAEKIKLYDSYFEKYPNGRHTDDVKKLMSNMVEGYYSQLKKELSRCESDDDWNACIAASDKFIEKFAKSPQSSEVEGLRIRFRKNRQHKEDLAGMKQKASALGENYEDAKKIYAEYLSANPESPPYMKKLIESESLWLDKQIQRRDREKKEWENLLAYLKNTESLTSRIQKLETYIGNNPTVKYIGEAKKISEGLKKEKAAEDEKNQAERDVREWQEVLAYSKNPKVSLADRIGKLGSYLTQNPSGKNSAQAKTILDQLRREKAAEDEQLRNQESAAARRNMEIQAARNLLRQAGGRFADNGDGTVIDTQTGLMWCLLDSSADSGKCMNYTSAEKYVANLRTGGYKNWRLPSVSELAGIYKTEPFFPTTTQKWFWSSEAFWHGWNKRVYVVTSEKEKNLSKQDMDIEQCGAVHAVRRR